MTKSRTMSRQTVFVDNTFSSLLQTHSVGFACTPRTSTNKPQELEHHGAYTTIKTSHGKWVGCNQDGKWHADADECTQSECLVVSPSVRSPKADRVDRIVQIKVCGVCFAQVFGAL
jgi:hypothetical protein